MTEQEFFQLIQAVGPPVGFKARNELELFQFNAKKRVISAK
ncbi:hypothetical protein [Paenibacillus ferrarius]